ncbi:hypothetical protein GH714_006832 [Hevea brasiliensis]|uniref:Uncharacterized protein n=1 Tax=Hevea brasiliensis TaxID=3981 RepID=A0A6A6KHE8_HEVBR|nr:hypothetical protein GH714_006832 [Hevea brasiliensis]
MLSARDLMIAWGDTPRYWKWTSELESRFAEVAELIGCAGLKSVVKLILVCYPRTRSMELTLCIGQLQETYGFEYQPVDVTVGLAGAEGCKRSFHLVAEREQQEKQLCQFLSTKSGYSATAVHRGRNHLQYQPERRTMVNIHRKEKMDGWRELGQFFNRMVKKGNWK